MSETRTKWAEALDPTFRAVFHETEENFNPIYPQIFNVLNSDRAFEKDTSIGGVGILEETAEGAAIPYEDATPGWDVTYTHKKFAKGRAVTEEMMDDEKFFMIPKLAKSLALAKLRTMEKAAADIFNYGFTAGGGGLAQFTGGDSLALFSTAHVNRDGTVSQSNRVTTPLTQSNLQTVLTAFKTRRDSKGQIITKTPDTLIVGPALEWQARIILESAGETTNNYNNINPVKGALNLIVWPYIESATAWFVMDSTDHELNFFKRQDKGIKGPIYDFDNEVAKWKAVCRFSVGYSDWMGIYGSKGDSS